MTAALSHILASSSEIWVSSKKGNRIPLDGFKQGQVIRATVDHMPSAREAVLDINGKKVHARTHMPLRPGDTLLLRVEGNGTQTTLKLLEAKGGRFIQLSPELLKRSGPYGLLTQMMKTLKPEPGGSSLSNEWSRLEALSQRLALKTGEADPAFMRTLIDRSGMTWEGKLARFLGSEPDITPESVKNLVQGDMKALTMRLAMQPASGDPAATGQFKAIVENLEHLQLLNDQSGRGSGRYLLPLPFLMGDAVHFGQLLIDLGHTPHDDPEDKNNRLVTVSFLLEMSNLGNVLADFSVLKQALNGSFSVENETVRQVVVDHIPDLKEKLKASGFSAYQIHCRVVKPETLAVASLVERVMPNEEGVLNIVI